MTSSDFGQGVEELKVILNSFEDENGLQMVVRCASLLGAIQSQYEKDGPTNGLDEYVTMLVCRWPCYMAFVLPYFCGTFQHKLTNMIIDYSQRTKSTSAGEFFNYLHNGENSRLYFKKRILKGPAK